MSGLHTFRAVALLAVFIALGPLADFGQAKPPSAAGLEAQSPGLTLKVTTRLVVLDIAVTDAHGNPVNRLLSKDDFEVFEDGQPQQIRSFETPAEHRMPASNAAVVNSAADLKKVGEAPVVIMVLDELDTRFEDMSYSRQMAIKYLRSQPSVLRQPTQLLIMSNLQFQQMHDWTQNRDELIRVIQNHMPAYPWKMMNSGKSGDGAVERMAQVLAALQQIAEASTGTPGRKNLIWVGNGFPSSNPIGLPEADAERIETAVRRVTSRLLAARITVYSINPALASSATLDIETPDDLDSMLDENGGDPFAGSIAFSNLALSTGGTAFTGRNDINNLIATGIERGADYYTLSYAPANHSEEAGKFRKIRVRMRDPKLRATTRNGYYPETTADLNPVLDATMSREQLRRNLELDFSSALQTAMDYNGLDVTAQGHRGSVWTLHVSGKGIGWRDPAGIGPQVEEATVAAGWYDAKGKLVGHVVREETATRDRSSSAAFSLSVLLPPGVARLRFVVRDAYNGHMGTLDITHF